MIYNLNEISNEETFIKLYTKYDSTYDYTYYFREGIYIRFIIILFFKTMVSNPSQQMIRGVTLELLKCI